MVIFGFHSTQGFSKTLFYQLVSQNCFCWPLNNSSWLSWWSVVSAKKTATTLQVTFFHFRYPTYPVTTMASGATMTWEDIHGMYIARGHNPIYVVKSQVSQLMVLTRPNLRESQIPVSPWYVLDQISVSTWYTYSTKYQCMHGTYSNKNQWVHDTYSNKYQWVHGTYSNNCHGTYQISESMARNWTSSVSPWYIHDQAQWVHGTYMTKLSESMVHTWPSSVSPW